MYRFWCLHLKGIAGFEHIVACQAHPALVKTDLVLACLFNFNSLLVRIHLVKSN